MSEQKLPEQRRQALPNETSRDRTLTVQLRPAVSAAGVILLVGGVGSLVFSGIGFLSALAIVFGVLTLLINGLLKRSQAPLDAFDQIESSQEQKIKELKRYVSKSQYLENVGGLGEKAADQLTQINERFKKFQDLLLLKFNPGEITFSRYHSAAEQTFLSILDNLNFVATSLNNINAIDPKYIDDRLKEATKTGAQQDAAEVASLKERKVLREQQISRIQELFSFNEKAITEFDRVSATLSETQTRKGESNIGLEASMAQLTELANRAKKYSVSS